MKIIALAAAVAAVGLLPIEASAAPQSMTTTTVKHNRNGTTTRTVVRTRSDRGVRNGWRWKTQCKTWWHHGRKYRSCKRVRVHW